MLYDLYVWYASPQPTIWGCSKPSRLVYGIRSTTLVNHSLCIWKAIPKKMQQSREIIWNHAKFNLCDFCWDQKKSKMCVFPSPNLPFKMRLAAQGAGHDPSRYASSVPVAHSCATDTVDGCEILDQLKSVVNIRLFTRFQPSKVMQSFWTIHSMRLCHQAVRNNENIIPTYIGSLPPKHKRVWTCICFFIWRIFWGSRSFCNKHCHQLRRLIFFHFRHTSLVCVFDHLKYISSQT